MRHKTEGGENRMPSISLLIRLPAEATIQTMSVSNQLLVT
jgi:hypothetical protein